MRDHLDRLRPQIEAALAYSQGSHTFDDVVAMHEAGQCQVWPAPHSIAITQVLESPHTKTLHFFLVGGDLDELKRLYPIILGFGKSVGCASASLLGRPGWQRTFLTKDEGWSSPLVYLTKEL